MPCFSKASRGHWPAHLSPTTSPTPYSLHVAADDVYLCPAGERLVYHYTNEERGLTLRRYWSKACRNCAIKDH